MLSILFVLSETVVTAVRPLKCPTGCPRGSGTIRIPLLFPVLRRFVYLERGCGPGGRG